MPGTPHSCRPTFAEPARTGPVVAVQQNGPHNGCVVFAADYLASWLVGMLADAGRRKLATFVLGDKQERALHQACQAALNATAAELRPDDAAAREEIAMVVGEVFGRPAPQVAAAHRTLREELQVGIAAHLAALGDRGITVEPGLSSADALGVSADEMAEKLTRHLLSEITNRGIGGGPLEPVANQLAHDRTYLEVLRLGGEIDSLAATGRGPASAPPLALAQLPGLSAVFTGRTDDLAVLTGLLEPAGPGAAVVVSAVAGLAGVGKTTLAVHAAHAAVRNGWFPAGCCSLTCMAMTRLP